jgi:CHAT domain-containing protein
VGIIDAAPEILKFANDLNGRKFLCISPDGALAMMPFSALPLSDGSRLIEHVGVAFCPSAGVLRYVLERSHPDGHSVLTVSVAAKEDESAGRFEGASAVPHAKGWKITELSGLEATRKAVLREMPRHAMVHATCHGFVDRDDPRESGLILSDGTARPTKYPYTVSISERRNSMLTVRDLADADNSLRLVTLQACSTAAQPEWSFDGPGGLVSGLLYGGAASVIATLWNVDQGSSRLMFLLIYRLIQDGEPLWRAVWRAQLAVLRDPEHAPYGHPYHYGPVALIGDWR